MEIRAASPLHMIHRHRCSGHSSAVGDMRKEQRSKVSSSQWPSWPARSSPWQSALECGDSYMPTWSHTGQKRLTGGPFVTPVKATVPPSSWRVFQQDLFSLSCHPVSAVRTDSFIGRFDNLPIIEVLLWCWLAWKCKQANQTRRNVHHLMALFKSRAVKLPAAVD